MAQECIVEACQERNDCQVIEERKIAADDEENLKRDEQDACDMPRVSRAERKPWHDEFGEMIPCRLEFVEPERRKVKVATNRTRDRLGLVVIVKASKIAPARVAAQFDQTRADHDTKPKPSKEPDDQNRRPTLGKRPSIEQRAKKDGYDSGFGQLNLPTVAMPDLADV